MKAVKRVEAARTRAVSALKDVERWIVAPPIIETKDDANRRKEISKLVDLARLDYGIRFYNGRAADNVWLFYDGNPETKKLNRKAAVFSVHCLFCRVMVVNGANLEVDYSAQVYKHTTYCALRCLAGLMEPGRPNTYRLPEEF